MHLTVINKNKENGMGRSSMVEYHRAKSGDVG